MGAPESHIPRPGRVALIAAGRVGTAVTILLGRAGWNAVGVASRSGDSARRGAQMLGAPEFALDGEIPEADLYILGATDDGIEELAESLAGRLPTPSVAVHLSGSMGIGVLEGLSATGVGTCALHPVQACPDIDTAVRRLPGSAWGVTCKEELRRWAHAVVTEGLGGRPVDVPEEVRPLWHASSVMTSNGISALLAFGERLLETVGIEDPESVLGPLAAGTVANAREGGGGRATLTGPIVRGETATVARHIEALEETAPDLADGYRIVAASILEAAARSGRIEPHVVVEMRQIIG